MVCILSASMDDAVSNPTGTRNSYSNSWNVSLEVDDTVSISVVQGTVLSILTTVNFCVAVCTKVVNNRVRFNIVLNFQVKHVSNFQKVLEVFENSSMVCSFAVIPCVCIHDNKVDIPINVNLYYKVGRNHALVTTWSRTKKKGIFNNSQIIDHRLINRVLCIFLFDDVYNQVLLILVSGNVVFNYNPAADVVNMVNCDEVLHSWTVNFIASRNIVFKV